MPNIILYTTDNCRFCRTAKSLLEQRNVPFIEENLARDPAGRAELAEQTGMMTFPQIVINGEAIGGYQELLHADRDGRLAALVA